ncbi:PAS domain-containing protein [Sphingomonas carotinifaciens]|uniref:PAS domain-containing protein n=1 Tax=Sphingomonas carotinifaciens TaxID=1166323 RepID=UPI000DDA0828|nr:PAS domain-containing protein [Sphingomonas carotinifaciens]
MSALPSSHHSVGLAPAYAARALDALGLAILMTEADTLSPGPIITYANPAMERLTGYSASELVGQTPRILQGAETKRDVLDALRAALADGRAFTADAINHRKDGTSYAVEWFIDPIRDADGVISAWVSIQRDVTRRRKILKALEETDIRLRSLVGELQHRTRNLMGIVRSMAQRTAESSADLGDFSRRFITRLEALARVQGLLSRLDQDERVTFDVLIYNEILALGGPAHGATLDGPLGICLRSSSVQPLSLALHELATNALKYGALGQEDAHLSITWSFEPEGQDGKPWLYIEWQESGVTMPSDSDMAISGQGRELIEDALPHQIGAHVAYALGWDGLRCSIALQVSDSNATSAWRSDVR